MNALEKLNRKNSEDKFVCVGLDTDRNKIPSHLLNSSNPILEFNKEIINATKEYAAAYKLNFAFYEKDGSEGMETLKNSIALIPQDVLIIGDAKRGDIGNTSEMYASAIFDYFKCDASTLHPYMGSDSIKPFLSRPDKLNFILALTSNPGNIDFEKIKMADGRELYKKVIEKVHEWNAANNCGIVFGATNITELHDSFEDIKDLPVLLPGVGAQGGSLEEVITAFKSQGRTNLLINVSRSIIYKSGDINFALAAREEILRMNSIVKYILYE